MHPNLEEGLRLLEETSWWLFSIQSSGYPHQLCGPECEEHRDDGSAAMEDCRCLTCHACYSATRDPLKLQEMWERYPHGLLAARTGLKSGIYVVDADRHAQGTNGLIALQAFQEKGQLPRTSSAYTGGGGIHLFYSHPGRDAVIKSSHSKIAPGLDVKGENSFVILPPSVKAGKTDHYQWAPDRAPYQFPPAEGDRRFESMLITPPEPIRKIVITVDFAEEALRELQGALGALISSPAGTSNNHLFRAACRAGEAVYGGAVELEQVKHLIVDAGRKRGIPTQDIKKTMMSGLRTGMADAKRGFTRDVR